VGFLEKLLLTADLQITGPTIHIGRVSLQKRIHSFLSAENFCNFGKKLLLFFSNNFHDHKILFTTAEFYRSKISDYYYYYT
jgi:hypothetical protein